MNKPSAFILDLDGTLMDTRPGLTHIHNLCLRSRGFPEHTPRRFATFMGGSVVDVIRMTCPPGTPEDIIMDYYAEYLGLYYDNCLDMAAPYPGITDFLSLCAEQEIPVAVLSNKTEFIARKMVKHFFPSVPFRFVWGNNGYRPLKPTPDAGFAAAKLLGLPPEDIAYVGDSESDMEFAAACGMLPLAACWGYRDRAQLSSAGAKKLLENPNSLFSLI